MDNRQEHVSIVVLMLEDSPLDAELSIAHLRRSGFNLDAAVAANRHEFLALVHARRYDVVLADYDLPGFNGLEALAMVRQHYPQLPFIFVSGVLGEEVAIDTLHRGATDYVLKQRLERLAPAVRRALAEAAEHASRLRAEANARESEERFRKLTNALPQIVWTMDDAGRLFYTNDSWHRTMPEEVKTWADPQVLHPDDIAACTRAWDRALRTRAPFSVECRYRTQHAPEYHWYTLRVVPFGDSAGNPCWLGTAANMHEEKKREEALRTAEKLAVTGRMAATIAHEINNPLESVVNLVYLLRHEPGLTPQGQQYLQIAENELQRIGAISRQTLAFYQESSTPAEVEATALVQEVLRLFDSRFRSKGLQVSLHADEQVTMLVDPGEIRQILINIIGNAIDAVHHGGAIRLCANASTGDGKAFAEIRVEDNGVGITPENLDRIFEPFFSTKGAHGTGLGLWVSKGIAEKHQGTLTIHSSPEAQQYRTVVTLRLPCAPASKGKETSGSKESAIATI